MEDMELHPYDNSERRFRHTDSDPATGLAIITRQLQLPVPLSPHDVLYDLSFYSGGIGIINKQAITFAADDMLWEAIITSIQAKAPEDAASDPSWAAELSWLFADDDAPISLRDAAVQFINQKRSAFQTPCYSTQRILIADGSDVNNWSVLWGEDRLLNYYGYDQG